ncbi:MAG: hypothetical protein WCC14_13990 [Acidobacteriaceae bacterium]
MANITIIFGLVLILLGIVAHTGAGSGDPHTMIPAYFGIALGVLGVMARSNSARQRKIVMHIAVVVGLAGFAWTAGSAWTYLQIQRGAVPGDPEHVKYPAAMAVLLLVFVLLCVRSFIKARRAKPA